MTTEILQALADKEAIREVLYRYCRAVDRRDWDLLRSVYFEDAFEDHGPVARCNAPEYIDIMQKRVEVGNRTISQHVMYNILIDLDGDTARSEGYFRAVVGGGGSTDLLTAGGRYIDQLERRDGQWRISHRIALVEWSHITTLLAGGGGVAGSLDEYYPSLFAPNDLAYQAELPLRDRFIPTF